MVKRNIFMTNALTPKAGKTGGEGSNCELSKIIKQALLNTKSKRAWLTNGLMPLVKAANYPK